MISRFIYLFSVNKIAWVSSSRSSLKFLYTLYANNPGVTRNFDWGGRGEQNGKILWRYFGNVI